ncbi:hypothetical protein Fmac_026833 [Flemingia macrophylla]|uniref:Rx N-terminal domain-containing protein n=1 Tax=Flemingia macrophylla TaxID=520843 RepID=A0ABD1LFZ5_9FABA
MAEMAVSFAREKLLPLIIDEANLLWGIPKEFAVIKKELEYIQAFLRDADRRAIEEGDNTNAGIKTWVKDLREASFRIEDVIDEYILYVEQHPDAFGCTDLLFEFLDGIKQRSKDYHFQIQPSIQQGPRDELIELQGQIESALIDNENGSRILITTIKMDVAKSFKSSRFDHVHELEPLNFEKSMVFEFEDAKFDLIPENWVNLAHLKCLSFKYSSILSPSIPEFICKLQNLETLDIRIAFSGSNRNGVFEMPKDICKLTKLRHLLGYNMRFSQSKNNLEGLTSLQTLSKVSVSLDEGELIKELAKLKQLRNLGLTNLKEENGSSLCSSINEMQNLKKLYVASAYGEVIDLTNMSSLVMLRKLKLNGKLNKIPEWIPQLQNLDTEGEDSNDGLTDTEKDRVSSVTDTEGEDSKDGLTQSGKIGVSSVTDTEREDSKDGLTQSGKIGVSSVTGHRTLKDTEAEDSKDGLTQVGKLDTERDDSKDGLTDIGKVCVSSANG